MKLNKDLLKRNLNFPFVIEIFDSIDSTSSYVKENNKNENQLIVANHQTNGKGRTGKSFYSPENGLYFSFKINNYEKKVNLDLLTIKIALVVIESLNRICQKKCQIKWVNDIYYHNKKVGGILSEIKDNNLIIGIGINLFKTKFPKELKEIATSLNLSSCDKNLLISDIVNNFLTLTDNHQQIIEKYKENCLIINKEVTFKSNNIFYNGIAIDINEFGNLLVKVNNEIISLSSGEVSIGSKKINS